MERGSTRPPESPRGGARPDEGHDEGARGRGDGRGDRAEGAGGTRHAKGPARSAPQRDPGMGRKRGGHDEDRFGSAADPARATGGRDAAPGEERRPKTGPRRARGHASRGGRRVLRCEARCAARSERVRRGGAERGKGRRQIALCRALARNEVDHGTRQCPTALLYASMEVWEGDVEVK